MHIRFDKEADVMYVCLDPLILADDGEMGEDDILYRYKNGEVIGVIVTYFSER